MINIDCLSIKCPVSLDQYSTNEDVANDLLDSLIDGFAKRDDLSIYIFDADTNKQEDARTFVVGKQDLEDSLPGSLWPQIVREVYGEDIEITDQDITSIIDAIPMAQQGNTLQANQKFAPKLSVLVKSNRTLFLESFRILLAIDLGLQNAVYLDCNISCSRSHLASYAPWSAEAL